MDFTHRARAMLAAVALSLAAALPALANPFEPGWLLQSDASSIHFTSVKNGSKVETSSFATITGLIEPDGTAEVRVGLDSVDTKVDLRNVRMRFLFFETFNHPEAVVSLQIPESAIADLPQVRRKVTMLPFTLSLHGVEKALETQVAITLLADDMVSVASSEPITLQLSDFNLMEGMAKLQEAAGVTIVPSATVTFDFVFRKVPDGSGPVTAAAAPAQTAAPAAAAAAAPAQTAPSRVALETQGDFSREECAGRFEILSQTGNIYFSTGSARLRTESASVLDSIADIVSRCPGMQVEVSGHTDSDGPSDANQRLSEQRARSVVAYLVGKGVPEDAVTPVGYGETRPVVPNTSAANKQRNRRIEFALAQ